MDGDIEGQLERRAARGDARGAADVWQLARSHAGSSGPNRPWALGAAAVLVAVAAITGVVVVTSDDPTIEQATEPTSTTTTTSGPPTVLIAQNASSLVPLESCANVLDEIKAQALERVGPFGLDGGFGSPPFFVEDQGVFPRRASGESTLEKGGGAPAYSETNTQEPGLDEPDLVETDGRRL